MQENVAKRRQGNHDRMNKAISTSSSSSLLSSSTSSSLSLPLPLPLPSSSYQRIHNNNDDQSESNHESSNLSSLTTQKNEMIQPSIMKPNLPPFNHNTESTISPSNPSMQQTSIHTSSSNFTKTFHNNSNNDNTNSNQKKRKTTNNNNDNFVRLNLRNNAGSCRGARNLRKHNRQKRWKAKKREEYWDGVHDNAKSGGGREENGGGDDNDDTPENILSNHGRRKQINSIHDAIDPIDDYLDGTFHKKGRPIQKTTSQSQKDTLPNQRTIQKTLCTRHNRQCKLLVVKKNTSGNKGRKFYVCSMPRGEQCDFFQWEDDTIESTQSELLQSSTQSGFIARQVASHIDRFKTLTVPELRIVAKQRKLDSTGKKGALIARLSVWVRDEICKDGDNKEVEMSSITQFEHSNSPHSSNDSGDDSDSSLDDDNSTSSEELEICGVEKSSVVQGDDSSTSSAELEIEKSSVLEPELNENSSDYDESNSSQMKSSLHQSLSDLFGYTEFRDGQEWAVKRCLAHKRTLFVAPTGMGKSLCYALPAALMDGVCIVVSPLISLIDDQLRQLPPRIPSASLSGNISKKNMAILIDDLLSARIKILFVSPEKLTSAAFRRLLRPKFNTETRAYERQLPPVSLLCIDEAHCLSQVCVVLLYSIRLSFFFSNPNFFVL